MDRLAYNGDMALLWLWHLHLEATPVLHTMHRHFWHTPILFGYAAAVHLGLQIQQAWQH